MNGLGLEQFRDYAVACSSLNSGPGSPSATRCSACSATWTGTWATTPPTTRCRTRSATAQILFYLEVPPVLFGRIAQGIATAAGPRATDHGREAVRHHLKSAIALNELMHHYFPRYPIYRVDHWLGLDPVRTCWFVASPRDHRADLNRTFVESIQITMAKRRRLRPGRVLRPHRRHPGRGAEPHAPGARDGDADPRTPGPVHLRDSKPGDLGDPPAHPEETVRGQYEGTPACRRGPASTVETFTAIRLMVDSWRWAGDPGADPGGQVLPVTRTEVAVRFQRFPYDVFGLTRCQTTTRCASGSGRRPRSA